MSFEKIDRPGAELGPNLVAVISFLPGQGQIFLDLKKEKHKTIYRPIPYLSIKYFTSKFERVTQYFLGL